MKKTLLLAAIAALALGGCVAVPVYDAGPAGGYYYGPPATFSFGYTYRDHGHGHRHAPPRQRYWR
ncbi:MAG: hypothetical protein IT531_08605 [Burkholderiales bacterium]|nr:hypothetical protein [Burkholderiales bacterium]